jgi:hypothetical protein
MRAGLRRGRWRRVAPALIVATTLAGLAVVVVATPAAAVTGTLTVTTLDRTGHAVRTQIGAVSVPTGGEDFFWTGAARRLPQGVYDIYAAIPTPSVGADTVGVRRIRVSGTTHVTIDARHGRAVRGYLRPAAPPGFMKTTAVWLCTADGSVVVGGFASDGPAYVIPSALPEVEFAFSSVWSAQDADDHGATYYAGAALHRKGAPAGITRTFRQSSLTQLMVKGRTGLQSGEAQVDVRFAPPDVCRGVTLQLFPQATLPYTLTMHLPPGPWSVSQFAQDSFYGPARRYAARRSYTVTVGAAAWGPSGTPPFVDQYCRCLVPNRIMFADPALPSGAQSRVTYTLVRRGVAIASKTIDPDQGTFAPKLPAAGWYTLNEVGVRHPINPLPANVLSPRSMLRWRFYVDPGRDTHIGGFVTRFIPRPLTAANRARTTTTVVALKLLRENVPAAERDAVKSVSMWMSADGGHAWHALHVRHVNGNRSATVTNPSSGYVTLRAKVVDVNGNAVTTTIWRAYAS